MFVSSHCFSLTPSDESKWQPLLSSFAVNKWPECGVRTSATSGRTRLFSSRALRGWVSAFLAEESCCCCLQRKEGKKVNRKVISPSSSPSPVDGWFWWQLATTTPPLPPRREGFNPMQRSPAGALAARPRIPTVISVISVLAISFLPLSLPSLKRAFFEENFIPVSGPSRTESQRGGDGCQDGGDGGGGGGSLISIFSCAGVSLPPRRARCGLPAVRSMPIIQAKGGMNRRRRRRRCLGDCCQPDIIRQLLLPPPPPIVYEQRRGVPLCQTRSSTQRGSALPP